jgi:hypothetical protein
MADLALLYKRGRTQIGSVVLDATIREDHTTSLEVTEHAVEDGSPVGDHARKKPIVLTLEGIITNTPATREDNDRTLEAQGFDDGTVNSIADKPFWAQTQYLHLLYLQDQRELLTVPTSLRTYDNMILENLSAPVDQNTGDALRFTATLRQVTIVKTEFSSTPTKKKNLGSVTGRKLTPAEAAQVLTPFGTNEAAMQKLGLYDPIESPGGQAP